MSAHAAAVDTARTKVEDQDPELQEEALLEPEGTSLKARMRQRREQLEQRTSEIFPVPRWTGLLAVELKAIGWDRTQKIMERHMRRPDQMALNSAADEIVAATIGFYQFAADDALEQVEGEVTWRQIAEGVLDLTADIPPATAQRVALLELCSGQGVMTLSALYRQWLAGANTGIGEELRRDFERTP